MPKALVNIVDCGTARRIGASFRTRRFGPEQELIDWFLSELPFEVPRNCRATLFLEPRLDSGYPDLVFATLYAYFNSVGEKTAPN